MRRSRSERPTPSRSSSRSTLDEYAEPRKRSWKNDRALLKAEVLPHWKHRAMRDITRRDVRGLIKAVFDRPAPIHANRARACLHAFFTFAIQHEIVDANPVRDVPKPSPEQVRARVLSPDEIRVFWQETETLPSPILSAMWKLRLLTAQRPQTEVAQMQWAESDRDGGWWTIPTTKAKNKIAHRVPLTAEAVELLHRSAQTSRKTRTSSSPASRGTSSLVARVISRSRIFSRETSARLREPGWPKTACPRTTTSIGTMPKSSRPCSTGDVEWMPSFTSGRALRCSRSLCRVPDSHADQRVRGVTGNQQVVRSHRIAGLRSVARTLSRPFRDGPGLGEHPNPVIH